ncbi:MAG: S-adenosylmethionine decarboxylase [Dehalococcoidia bacterium]|nr:S-adenosylmethionine decarboxylase [Dehalococcoidia bacterium]MDD5493631.1 S-adenosylmethionine decarboxylase [Dehalococcoidia bacterium]
MHLIIDGFGKNKNILKDEKFIYELLNSYPAKIGMTKISDPMVFKYSGVKPQDWGVTGLVFIAESHISLHTFVERNFINIDVFSCKDFDADRIISDLKDKFELVKLRSCLVRREWDPAELHDGAEILQLNTI